MFRGAEEGLVIDKQGEVAGIGDDLHPITWAGGKAVGVPSGEGAGFDEECCV